MGLGVGAGAGVAAELLSFVSGSSGTWAVWRLSAEPDAGGRGSELTFSSVSPVSGAFPPSLPPSLHHHHQQLL